MQYWFVCLVVQALHKTQNLSHLPCLSPSLTLCFVQSSFAHVCRKYFYNQNGIL